MHQLESALGVDTQSAARAQGAPHDAAHARTGAFAAEPAVARAERTAADDLAVGSHPLHTQDVLGVAAHPERARPDTRIGAGAGDERRGAPRSDDDAVPAPLDRFGLKLGGDHIGFDDGDAVLLVDLEDLVHAAHVELHGVGVVVHGGRPVVPAGAMRLDLDLVLVGQPGDGLHFLGRCGHDHRHRTGHVVAEVGTDEVRQPLESVRVEYGRVPGDVLRADDIFQALICLLR